MNCYFFAVSLVILLLLFCKYWEPNKCFTLHVNYVVVVVLSNCSKTVGVTVVYKCVASQLFQHLFDSECMCTGD